MRPPFEEAPVDAGRERCERLARTRIYLVVTPSAHGPRWRDALEAAVPTGAVGMVQLREKTLSDAGVVTLARSLLPGLRRQGVLLLLNDRPHLVDAVDADGVHVGEDDPSPEEARRLVGPARLVGLSTHDEAEVGAARARGVDYVGLGPCFPSTTKRPGRTPGGAALVARGLVAARGFPVFPIGGIDRDGAARLVRAGADRLAVGAAVLEAPDPAEAVFRLLEVLEGGGPVGEERLPPNRASI